MRVYARWARWETVFFFFQAEDGIRDDLVTGVQTCALPILGEDDIRRVGVPQFQDGLGKAGDVAGKALERRDPGFRYPRRHRGGGVTKGPLLHVAPEVRFDVQHHALAWEGASLLKEQRQVVVVRRHGGGVG